jgi:hypothetical protein
VRKGLCAVLASAACLASTIAMAEGGPASTPQSAPPAGAATTVAPVTVKAPSQATIERQSYSFVRSHVTAGNPEVGQIGRWYDAVCVEVVGLPLQEQADAIKARIESVAQAVGLRKASKTCSANVEIVFSVEPQRVMDMVADRRQYLLGYYHAHLANRLKHVTHPIQSWYVTATESSVPDAAILAMNHMRQYTHGRAAVTDDPDIQGPGGCAASHFTSCLQSEFANVFIVADSRALQGKELGMVADYMVMLALSQPRSLDVCNGLSSVLDLFANPGCDHPATDGLTPADAAYLTSLYKSDLRAKGWGEQGEISLRMTRMLIKANPEAPGQPKASR